MRTTRLYIALAGILLLSASFKPSEELKWLGFNEGYELAKKKNKIMLVDVYTDWCGWCKRMDRDTYAKQEIIEALQKDFVVIKFNPEIPNMVYSYEGKKYDGQQLAGVISNYQLSGYPTTIFIQPKAKKSNLVSGYFNAEKFKGVLSEIVSQMGTAKK